MNGLPLAGRAAIVTGAANGIGACIVQRLRRDGANVAIVDMVEPDLDNFVDDAAHGELIAVRADVSQASAVEAALATILDRFGRIEIFVANAGGAGRIPAAQIEDLSDDAWYDVLDTNLTSIIRFCRRLVPGMREARHGRIIAISSGARHGIAYPMPPTIHAPAAYATAKSAMDGLVRQLAKDLGPSGITANAVSPGFIQTKGNSLVTQTMLTRPEIVDQIIASIPVGRAGRGEDIAAMVAFLASDDAGFVSGETIEVRGG